MFLPAKAEEKQGKKPEEQPQAPGKPEVFDSTAKLFVDSEPRDALVHIDGKEMGKTPYTAEVDLGATGNREVLVSVSKDGYKTKMAKFKLSLGDKAEWKDVRLEKIEAVKTSVTPQSQPPTDLGSKQITGKDGIQMVLIPAGEFQMGSNDVDYDGKPVHTVYVDAFYMDVHEVTNAQYKEFMEATKRSAPAYWNDPNFNPPNQPVVGVTWEDAKAYCEWAGERLPTEAEWEKAARGGLVGKKFPWGDEASRDYANYFSSEGKDTWSTIAPVCSFTPNEYGLYDMAGNVWEWCADWYGENYYSASPKENPKGPDTGYYRVLRGGSWNLDYSYLYVAKRYSRDPLSKYNDQGFRCVKDAR